MIPLLFLNTKPKTVFLVLIKMKKYEIAVLQNFLIRSHNVNMFASDGSSGRYYGAADILVCLEPGEELAIADLIAHEIDKVCIVGTAVFDGPPDEIEVSAPGRVLVHVRVPCAPLLPCPLEDVEVPPLGRPVAGAEIPRTTLAPQPLKRPQVTAFRGLSAVPRLEGEPPIFQPLQNM
mmetsp:Transcript_980/g.1516  ORF Transcript_980/g.1516 Transcript_980/m.1516 type:complete len:177 (-) Transcript_980:234-764(-)